MYGVRRTDYGEGHRPMPICACGMCSVLDRPCLGLSVLSRLVLSCLVLSVCLLWVASSCVRRPAWLRFYSLAAQRCFFTPSSRVVSNLSGPVPNRPHTIHTRTVYDVLNWCMPCCAMLPCYAIPFVPCEATSGRHTTPETRTRPTNELMSSFEGGEGETHPRGG